MSSVKEVVEAIWSQYDKDKSGFLDRQEATRLLEDVFKQLNVPFTSTKADHVFKLIDANNDGKITKNELVGALQKS